ncbi:MAG: hypothetical protein WDO14_05105 [Bacteroidota bacterium]
MQQGEQAKDNVSLSLERDFEEMHIAWVWAELHERFGFPLKEWKKLFIEYCVKQKRDATDVGAFFAFGNASINPILNRILQRQESSPTWNKLCLHVLNKKR